VAALAGKIRVLDDPSIDADALEPARVKIVMNDGRKIEVKSDTVKGSPQDPMSEHEILAKFRDCLESGLGTSRANADKLTGAIMNIENATDAGAVIAGAFPSYSRA
jgi:2-methylcitrate dehydratase PrpD